MATQVTNDTQPPPITDGNDDAIITPAQSPYYEPSSEYASAVARAGFPQFFTPGHLSSQYTFCTIVTEYETNEGIVVSPTTAAATSYQDSNSIVRVSRPCTKKVVRWSVQRAYVKPVCPHWNTGSQERNEVLIRKSIAVRNPHQDVMHKFWWAGGVYVYGFRKEPIVTIGGTEYFVFVNGVPAAETSPTVLHSFDQGDFSFIPLDASWVKVNPSLMGGKMPIGRTGRANLPSGVARASTS